MRTERTVPKDCALVRNYARLHEATTSPPSAQLVSPSSRKRSPAILTLESLAIHRNKPPAQLCAAALPLLGASIHGIATVCRVVSSAETSAAGYCVSNSMLRLLLQFSFLIAGRESNSSSYFFSCTQNDVFICFRALQKSPISTPTFSLRQL